jgi:hypothetical protein
MHSAKGATSRIDVGVVDNGKLTNVWAKGKAETENGHAAIIELLKPLLA